MLAGGCLVSAMENAGVLCTVQVSSRSLCVTIRDNTPSGHQSAWSSWGHTEVAPHQRWPGYRRRLQWLLAVRRHLHPSWDW